MAVVSVVLVSKFSWGFNGHIGSDGPVKITIGGIEKVVDFDKAATVDVVVGNSSVEPVKVLLEMGGLVDEWYAVGQMKKEVACAAKANQKATFQIACGKGAVSALYPVHVRGEFSYGGDVRRIHCVQIFETDFHDAPAAEVSDEMPVNVVPAVGGVSLCSLKSQRVVWRFFDKPEVNMPVGWKGADERSGAYFSTGTVYRGTGKEAITMHPAWRGAAGTVFADYVLKLPKTDRIEFRFANAIRDNSAEEPASDGVAFRVWVGSEKLFDRFTDSKEWVEGRADLSRFAGGRIRLRLESHPGPKNNTTCDSSYWGEPVIVAGETGKPANRSARRKLFAQTVDDCTVSIVSGDYGLLDGKITFGKIANPENTVSFDGLNVSIMGDRVGASSSGVVVLGVEIVPVDATKVKVVHHLSAADEEFDLNAVIFADRGGVRIGAECDKRITDICVGAANQKARRVYYGHGYCIEEPRAFRAGFGGHNLSTSFVGFDFEKGVSLVTAVDNPPDYLEVSPEQNIYALHTHQNATLTFVAGTKGAFDCAVKYRGLYDRKASPGFADKAGRFVFDIWGGRYTDNAAIMKKMVDYGLTDSLLTLHVWQRWGYDYRLPDIYPPNPDLGTVKDMKSIGAVCDAAGIAWGLHDNYIDFYPDADDYSYDHICFNESGEPVKAWINEGRGAQSYRWRPDHIMPFVKRNLELIRRDLHPNHYFIDVFTSINMFDFYDKQGDFHSMLETRRRWGESFRWIQDYLGGAVTTSEAGDDQLVGYLDGADCQHLTLSTKPESFTNRISCDDWERTAWFDTVLHDRFSLHGVGYSSRYKVSGDSGGREVLETDDYISAEMLTGHAMMIDRRGFGRGAVRKYWLGQGFLKSIATDTIAGVEFADNDIHRQIVRWNSGAKVYVNRGPTDWRVGGKVLPQYGYRATNGDTESSIEKIDGVIVERSKDGGWMYFNGRGCDLDDAAGLRPEIDKCEYLGDRRFRMPVRWKVLRTIPKDVSVFLHFCSDSAQRSDKIAFQGDSATGIPVSRWTGEVTTGVDMVINIPQECGPGEYDILTGMWDPATSRRYRLIGEDAGETRYRLGRLVVEGDSGTITGVRVITTDRKEIVSERINLDRRQIDFGQAITAGAFRCNVEADSITVTPLPEMESFEVILKKDMLGAGHKRPASVVAVDPQGSSIRPVEYKWADGRLVFETKKGEFAYRVPLADN